MHLQHYYPNCIKRIHSPHLLIYWEQRAWQLARHGLPWPNNFRLAQNWRISKWKELWNYCHEHTQHCIGTVQGHKKTNMQCWFLCYSMSNYRQKNLTQLYRHYYRHFCFIARLFCYHRQYTRKRPWLCGPLQRELSSSRRLIFAAVHIISCRTQGSHFFKKSQKQRTNLCMGYKKVAQYCPLCYTTQTQ